MNQDLLSAPRIALEKYILILIVGFIIQREIRKIMSAIHDFDCTPSDAFQHLSEFNPTDTILALVLLAPFLINRVDFALGAFAFDFFSGAAGFYKRRHTVVLSLRACLDSRSMRHAP